MYCVKKMTEDLYWVGASDRRLALFENVYPISRGVSYNSYLLLDEKTVLLDTADSSVSGIFFENVEHVLNGRPLDYLIVNHMEPDHCALMQDLVLRELMQKLFSGTVSPNPIVRGPMVSSCQYCEYQHACHKDACKPDVRYMKKVGADEFWKELERRKANG